MDIRRDLPISPDAAKLARETLDGWLSDLVGDETASGVRLAASELVENAVRYAGLKADDVIRLSGVATKDVVHIEVEQPTPTVDVKVVAAGERGPLEGGFGLRIVEQIATKWGVRPETPGAVWFEVDRDVI
jgi:anti-sigma regulatory factor (Ser/Thr protein kinase)